MRHAQFSGAGGRGCSAVHWHIGSTPDAYGPGRNSLSRPPPSCGVMAAMPGPVRQGVAHVPHRFAPTQFETDDEDAARCRGRLGRAPARLAEAIAARPRPGASRQPDGVAQPARPAPARRPPRRCGSRRRGRPGAVRLPGPARHARPLRRTGQRDRTRPLRHAGSSAWPVDAAWRHAPVRPSTRCCCRGQAATTPPRPRTGSWAGPAGSSSISAGRKLVLVPEVLVAACKPGPGALERAVRRRERDARATPRMPRKDAGRRLRQERDRQSRAMALSQSAARLAALVARRPAERGGVAPPIIAAPDKDA